MKSPLEMGRLLQIVVFLAIVHVLALADGMKTYEEMTEEERIEFAMKSIEESFVMDLSLKPGYQSSLFGEIGHDNLAEPISTYQRLHSIPVTGIPDKVTIEEMMLPKCGVRDINSLARDLKRRKRYAIRGRKWNASTPLTYHFHSLTEKLPYDLQKQIIVRAFQAWSDVTDLEFREGTEQNKIFDIRFALGYHNDDYPFDGPGSVLAHAFFPGSSDLAGDVHFDDAEQWSGGGGPPGFDLYRVALHEIGHSLGLGHSTSRTAIMFPSYISGITDHRLHEDDINGIQYLYGRKKSFPSTTVVGSTGTGTTTSGGFPRVSRPTAEPPPIGREAFCSDGRVDAITSFLDVTYIFKGNQYAVLTDSGVHPKYPRPISDIPGLEGLSSVDAAMTWSRHSVQRMYIFKGEHFWRYQENGLQPGYPRLISDGFPGIPPNIDSAFVWMVNGFSYIFKGNQYYKLTGMDGKTNGRVAPGYPRDISWWNASKVFPRFDAIFSWAGNNRAYLFHNDEYVRLHRTESTVDEAYPPYPRKTSIYWLKCAATEPGIGGDTPRSTTEILGGEGPESLFEIVPHADNQDFNISSASTFGRRRMSLLIACIIVMAIIRGGL